MTASESFELWLKTRYNSETTIYTYKRMFIQLYTLYMRGNQINQESIDRFCRDKPHPKTRSFLRCYFRYAKIVPTSFEIPILRSRQSKLPVYVTKQEVDFLLQNMNTLQNKCLILLLFEGGLRASEVCRLKKTDFNFVMNEVRGMGKGKKEYIVNYSNKTKELLQEYFKQFSDVQAFPNFYREKLYRIITKHKTLLGKDRLFPHAFRHGIATHLKQLGWDLRDIQEYLRHKHLATVEPYAHVTREEIKQKWKQTME